MGKKGKKGQKAAAKKTADSANRSRSSSTPASSNSSSKSRGSGSRSSNADTIPVPPGKRRRAGAAAAATPGQQQQQQQQQSVRTATIPSSNASSNSNTASGRSSAAAGRKRPRPGSSQSQPSTDAARAASDATKDVVRQRMSRRAAEAKARESEPPEIRTLSDEEREKLLDICAAAFPDGCNVCVHVVNKTNRLEIMGLYPPKGAIPEEPFNNRTSQILNEHFGSEFANKYNWNDFMAFAPNGNCENVDLNEMCRVLLSNPQIIADCFARLMDTLADNKVLYIAGGISHLMFSIAQGWGVVKELEAPGEFGVGRYEIGGHAVYAICAYHPSSGITAQGKGSARRVLDRDLHVISAALKIAHHGYGVDDLDEAIAEIVSEQVKAWKNGAENIQKYLDIQMEAKGWWPAACRVLRILNLADPEYLNTMKWLHEVKGVPKETIRRLIAVPGFASRIAHDDFKLMFDSLLSRLRDLDLVISVLSRPGTTGHLTDDLTSVLDLFDLFVDLFGDKGIALKMFKTSGVIHYSRKDLDGVLSVVDRLLEWFEYRLDLVAALLSTDGLIGHSLRHPQAAMDIIERLFEWFGSKDLIVRFLSCGGVIGKLLSDTTKSLKGVDLLVKKIGPVSAATVLCHNSNFMVPYLEDSEVVEKALNELLDHFQDDKDGCQAALTGGISFIGFLKQYVENRDAALRFLPEPSLRTAIPVKRRLTAEKLPGTEDKLGRAAYDVKVPPKYELGPDRKFTVFVDGVECTVTCPDNVRPGSYLQFRPFDSFDLKHVVFCTSSHGLILNKTPGQTFLQLAGVVEGSEGSRCEEVAALVQKKYFLRAIGPSPAPNSIESALKALQAVKASPSSPLVVVFGPPGPPEEVSEL